MPVKGFWAAMRDFSVWARGVGFVGRRGGREGCGVWVWEGGRRELMRAVAAERECGPVEGGGGSMSGVGVSWGLEGGRGGMGYTYRGGNRGRQL